MSWLSLLTLLIKCVNYISRFMMEQQLLNAGEARALLKLLEDTNARLGYASKARADSVADSMSGGLHNDDGHKRED